MKIIEPQSWKPELQTFKEAAAKYYAGEMKRNEYKGISGRFGSYAQKGDDVKLSMLRLRLPAGRLTKEKMAYMAESIRKYNVNKVHFTTCQTVQLHNLNLEATCNIMEGALDAGIVTVGGGGDFPRNTTCSPLSGIDKDEYFDVMPYAEIAGQYAMKFINMEKLPRKYKIGFSSSPKNVPHATMRDLGFVARPDGKFDVYSAGGIGPNPKVGVKVAEAVEKEDILIYVYAMWVVFRENSDYKNRAKNRSRYMQERVGGPEKYREIFQAKVEEVKKTIDPEEFKYEVTVPEITKKGNGTIDNVRALPQKQDGLYTVVWHPHGGIPKVETFCKVSDALQEIEAGEIRLSPEETAYIINLTAEEAQKFIDMTADDSARNQFEMASSCIGSSICQVGVRDSQALLRECIQAVEAAELPYYALPAIHISGCPASCATPQLAPIGFRGAVRDRQSAFLLTVNGNDRQGEEVFGREVGVLFETEIPQFLVDLGKTVAASGKTYAEWIAEDPEGVDKVAVPYLPQA